MSTISIYLYPIPRKDGLYPVYLRHTHKRKTAYRTLFYIRKGHFRSGKVVPSFAGTEVAKNLNDIINTSLDQTKEIIEIYERNGWPFTAREIIEVDYDSFIKRINQLQQEEPSEKPLDRDTIIFAGMHLAETFRRAGGFENYRKYKSEMDSLSEFLATIGKADYPISDLPDIIDDFFNSLRKRKVHPVKSDSTLKRKLAQLNAIIRHAHREGFIRKLILLKTRLDVVKARKKKLSAEEIKRLEQYEWPAKFEKFPDRPRETSQKARRLAVETFLMQYYCFGARVGDIIALRNENIRCKNGVVHRIEYYPMKARRKNEGKKLLQVDIPPPIRPVVEKYYRPDKPEAFLLPWVKPFLYEEGLSEPEKLDVLKTKIKSQVSYMDEALKDAIRQIGGFSESFSSHSARHSFAQRAKKKNKSIEFIKEALYHSNYDTTKEYLEDLDADELNEKMQDIYD